MPSEPITAAARSPHVAAGEAPFGLHEVFFSRTDQRGVIQSGNGVFRRVSQYDWHEMLRHPHRIVRHPDMPRGVFHLLWERIGAGRPTGAYVKNRAKDGRHYWVFAIVTPIQGGYLSVRLKPSSDLLAVIDREYRALRRLEVEDGLSPAASAAALAGRLAAMGHDGYDAFMAAALAREVAARDAGLGRADDPMLERFRAMMATVEAIRAEASTVIEVLRGLVTVSTNIQIQAIRLEGRSGPLGVVASNYEGLSAQIHEGLEQFARALDAVFGEVTAGLFLVGTARIQDEVAAAFEDDADLSEAISREAEGARLREQRERYAARAQAAAGRIARQATAFAAACARMNRLASGLDVTRVQCKMESARVRDPRGSLDEIVAELDRVQRVIADCLGTIGHRSRAVLRASAVRPRGSAAPLR